MREGWLVDPGTNWVWRFHRDDKAWVRDPKVFMDRGMAMPNGEPPLLKERRHVPQKDAETIWRNLKSGVEAIRTAMGCLSRTLTSMHKKSQEALTACLLMTPLG